MKRTKRARPAPDPEPGRCQAVTLAGARCKLPGDPWCVIHKPKAGHKAA